jgi:hypothetical protein
MNENTQNILDKIKEAQKIIKDSKKNLEVLFNEQLTELLKRYAVGQDTLKSIDIYLNNHEFNDGEATYFGFNHEDLTAVFEDELGNETEIDGYGNEKPELVRIREQFKALFSNFDVDGFYEDIFGQEFGTIRFRIDKNGKLQY